MIEFALARRNLRVIVACRTFDLEDDQRFKAWERELAVAYKDGVAAKRIEVSILKNSEVRAFFQTHGGAYEQLEPTQRELLRVPLCLYLWWTLQSENALPDCFTTSADLMREFWVSRRKKLAAERSITESEITDCLSCVVEYLDREGRQDFPGLLVARYQSVVDAIRSLNVIQAAQPSTLKFAHQSFLDYLVAERVLSESIRERTSPLEWLRKRDQSLFRREQLRQLLFLQREQLPGGYVELLRQLIHDQHVRFHLRHLALGMLKAADPPSDSECKLLLELLDDDSWWKHALMYVVRSHGTWIERCHSAGIFQQWLESENDEKINWTLWVLRFVPATHRHIVDETLFPLIDLGDPVWAKRLDGTLPNDTSEDSEASFEWRLKRVRSGAIDVHLYALHSAVKKFPLRVAKLLAAMFERRIDVAQQSLEGDQSEKKLRLPDFERSGWDELLSDIHLADRAGWNHLLPVLVRSVRVTRQIRCAQLERRKHSNPTSLFMPAGGLWHLHRELTRVNGKLRHFLTRIGHTIIPEDFPGKLQELSKLDLRRSRTLNHLAAVVLCAAPPANADEVLRWLLADVRRFQLRGSRSMFVSKPAARLIARFSPTCSDALFSKLEAAVLAYHGPEEKYSVEIQLRELKESGKLLANHYGRGQFVLLSAMAKDRLSDHARSALATWLGKFGNPGALRQGNGLRGGCVSSSIPNDRRHLMSDGIWLRLISTAWQTARQRRRADNWLAERSHRMFAQDFGEQAKMNPSRFVRLANLIPLNAPIEYFENVLRALQERTPPQNRPPNLSDWEPAPFEDVQALILKLIDLAVDNQLANAICWVVRNRASEPWHLRITDYVACMSVSASTPCGEPFEFGDSGLNPWEGVRGSAVETLHWLISNHSGFAIRYLPEIMQCIRDTHPSVRVAATGLCNAWARWNMDSAVQLFLAVCDHRDDRVMSGYYVPEFLRYVWKRYSSDIEPLLCRMVDSHVNEVAELGAYRATGGWFTNVLYGELAERCRTGTVPMRKGFAKALADLSRVDEFRDSALEALPDFFDDTDEEVSNQAAHVFYRNAELLEHPAGIILALKLAQSQAFLRDPSDLLEPLHQYSGSLLPYMSVMIAVVDAAAGPLADLISNMQTRHARVSRMLPDLLLRLYQEADGQQNEQVRHQCLNAWDRLLESHVVGIDTLNVIDT